MPKSRNTIQNAKERQVKKILLLAVVGGAYYYSFMRGEEINIESYQALLKKVDSSEVSLAEVKTGSHLMVEFFCNDESFQLAGGSSVAYCLENYNTLKLSCDEEVFNSAPDTFTKKENVIATASLYSNCIGVM